MDAPLPKALFIAPDGNIYPDYLICSGALGGEPCPFAQNGRIPDPRPLDFHFRPFPGGRKRLFSFSPHNGERRR
jgi:hypothetical protein